MVFLYFQNKGLIIFYLLLNNMELGLANLIHDNTKRLYDSEHKRRCVPETRGDSQMPPISLWHVSWVLPYRQKNYQQIPRQPNYRMVPLTLRDEKSVLDHDFSIPTTNYYSKGAPNLLCSCTPILRKAVSGNTQGYIFAWHTETWTCMQFFLTDLKK